MNQTGIPLKRSLVFIAALILICSPLQAQDFSLFSYRTGEIMKTEDDESVRIQETQIRLPIPAIKLATSTSIQGAIGYHHADFDDKLSLLSDSPIDAFRVDIQLKHQLNDDWDVSLAASERINRNTETNSDKREVFSQIALFGEKQGSISRWVFGVVFRTHLSAPIVPIVGITRPLSEKWALDALLPGRLHIWRTIKEDQSRIGFHTMYQTQPFVNNLVYLEHRTMRVGVTGEARVYSNLFLRVDASHTLLNTLDLEFANDEITQDIDNGVLFDVALRYRIPSK